MSSIRILGEHVRNLIAAGEVIERPASAVKELVENSIDSGADRITIELAEGGNDLIRVADNGRGIPGDDLPLAVQRHATSKINSADDLNRIITMGFRGEALPSIASVSRFRLASKPADAAGGREIRVEGEAGPRLSEIGMADGTVVEVSNLFFNTPARRKFLKKPSTELRHITQMVINLALAHSSIQFTLKNNDREVLHLPVGNDTGDRIFQVFGRRIRENLLQAEVSQGAFELTVYGVKPAITKADSKSVYSYVNGRFFRGRDIVHAVRTGYARHIPRDRWPIVIVFITTDPDLVDVNVHPGKTEVRFQEGRYLHGLIRDALDDMLREASLSVAYAPETEEIPTTREASYTHEAASLPTAEASASDLFPAKPGEPSVASPPRPARGGGGVGGRFMQVYDSYIIVETEDRLTVYDQHALHEGILESKLREGLTCEGIASQELLIPDQLELTAPEKDLILGLQELLVSLGFTVQDFAGNTLVIHAIPAMLDTGRIKDFFQDILAADSEDLDVARMGDRLQERIINRIACHSAIRANQKLTPEEIESLLAEAAGIPDAASCAHGRPSGFDLLRTEIEKRFQRR